MGDGVWEMVEGSYNSYKLRRMYGVWVMLEAKVKIIAYHRRNIGFNIF